MAHFAGQDFILVEADQTAVLEALVRERAALEAHEPPRSPGLFKRLRLWLWMTVLTGVMRLLIEREMEGAARQMLDEVFASLDAEHAPPSRLHVDAAAEPARAITWGANAAADPMVAIAAMPDAGKIRVSGLATRPGLVLVELAEMASGMSPTAYSMSTLHAGADVHYFRRAGTLTENTQRDHHLYRNGDQVRRVLVHRTVPPEDPGDAWWEGDAEGAFQPHENAGDDAVQTEAEILTAEKQASIPRRLIGVEVDALLAPTAKTAPVLLALKPGGAPLREYLAA